MPAAFKVVIPARYAASRLPGKPLLAFQGKPVIQHVYEKACASGAESVWIATDDQRIAGAAQKFNAPVCMTRDDHVSGTDRIAEVAAGLAWQDDEIIVNVQADEPQMPAANIRQVAELLIDHAHMNMATLCHRLQTIQEYHNPNVVKVATALNGNALYFSRSPIPYVKHIDSEALSTAGIYRHAGIYAYRVAFLRQFVQMAPSGLEKLEKLEQLRALENNHSVIVAACLQPPGIGVDTIDDYHKLNADGQYLEGAD